MMSWRFGEGIVGEALRLDPLCHRGINPLLRDPSNEVRGSTRLLLILLLGVVGGALASGETEEQRRQREYSALMSERQGADQYHDELTEAWNLYSALNIPEATRAFGGVRTAEGVLERDLVQALYGLGL